MKTTITLTREEVSQIILDHFYKDENNHAKTVYPNIEEVTTGCYGNERTQREFTGYTAIMEDK